MQSDAERIRKYAFIAAVVLVSVISYFIIKDFIVPIISGIVLAYLVMPLHKRLSRKIPKTVSAFILIILIIFVSLAGFIFVSNTLIAQAESFGLKENVIVGHLIPAGTGNRRFHNVIVGSKEEYDMLIESTKASAEVIVPEEQNQ